MHSWKSQISIAWIHLKICIIIFMHFCCEITGIGNLFNDDLTKIKILTLETIQSLIQ